MAPSNARGIDKRNVSLNLNVRGLGLSPTLDISERVAALRGESRKIYNMGLGQSPFPVPPILVDSLRLHASRKEYLPVAGLRTLREAVATYHAKKDVVEASPDNVLVGPGSKELLFLLQLTYYGEIIVPSPCWVSYTPQSRIVGRNVKFIRTHKEDDWKVKPERLAQMLETDRDRYRPRLLVLNYPANPTGVTYTASELKALAKVAREFEIVVLSDEIYSGLHYDGKHASIARHYPEGTIILNGISKWAGAGGWRLGTFTFPPDLEWLKDAMAAVASETYTSVSAPIQYAAVRAFEQSESMERYLAHARRILKHLGLTLHKRLTDTGIDVVKPQGAFYMFPDFSPFREELKKRGIHTGEDLAHRVLDDAGVAMLPGIAFNRPEDELTARVAFVDFDGAEAMLASEAVDLAQPLPSDFLEFRAGAVLEGFDKLCEWVEKGP